MNPRRPRARGLMAFGAIAGLCAALLVPEPAEARDFAGQTVFGLGVIAGEPTGGTLKLWFGPRFAIQSHLALTWWRITRFAAYLDLLWHPAVVTSNRYFILLWYFGVGGGAGFRAPWDERSLENDRQWEADPAAWVRVPFGFPFIFDKVPVEAFVEFGPALRVYPPVGIGPFVAIGGRWYF